MEGKGCVRLCGSLLKTGTERNVDEGVLCQNVRTKLNEVWENCESMNGNERWIGKLHFAFLHAVKDHFRANTSAIQSFQLP